MPKEKFYKPERVEGDEPDLTLGWGVGGGVITASCGVCLNTTETLRWGVDDISGLGRLIRSLKRVREQIEHLMIADHEAANHDRRLEIARDAFVSGKTVLWLVGNRGSVRPLLELLAPANPGGGRFTALHALGRERLEYSNGTAIASILFASVSTLTDVRGVVADVVVLDEVPDLPTDARPILATGAELIHIKHWKAALKRR